MSESKEGQQEGATQELFARWLEGVIAILLGVVVVATAWSGYQAARWSGVQLYSYGEDLYAAMLQAIQQAKDRIVFETFIDFWNMHCGRRLPPLSDHGTRSWDPHIAIHRNDPRLVIFPIRTTYLEAIDRARHHIYLTHAYFIPDRILLRALMIVKSRTVDRLQDTVTATTPVMVPTYTWFPERVGVAKREVEPTDTVVITAPVWLLRA